MREMTDRTLGPPGPVLVTGGNGYVASWLVKRLLGLGHDVHATVSQSDGSQGDLASRGHRRGFAGAPCRSMGRVAGPAGLRPRHGRVRGGLPHCIPGHRPGSQGPDACPHRACDQRDPERPRSGQPMPVSPPRGLDLQCRRHLRRRRRDGRNGRGVFHESHWNETSSENHHPYAYSKVLAERLAWEIAGSQNRWNLVAVNPGSSSGLRLAPTRLPKVCASSATSAPATTGSVCPGGVLGLSTYETWRTRIYGRP